MSRNELTPLVQTFLISRQAAGLSPRTVEFYAQQLGCFLTHLESHATPCQALPSQAKPSPAGPSLADLTSETIERYLAERQTQVSARTVHAAWRAIRAFCNWLHTRHPDWANPISTCNAPKLPRQKVPPVDREVVEKMVKTCKGHLFFTDRDRAILLVLASSGLRSGEFLNLKQEDVNLANGALRVTRGKGGTCRITIIDPKARLALADYLGHLTQPGPLWVGLQGPLTYAGLVGILRRRAVAANVPAPSPHAFRRRWASDMVPKLGPWVVQALGGWSDIESMKPYISLSESDLLDAYQKGLK